MSEILTDRSPATLAVAVKANLYAFFTHLRHVPMAEVHESAGAFRWHTPVAHPWFNGVLCSLAPSEQADGLAQESISYFTSRAGAGFTWWLAPGLDAAPWSQHLAPLGFRYDDHTPGMAVDLAAMQPPAQGGLTLQVVEDQATLAEWAATFIRGYGIPEAATASFLGLLEGMGTGLPFRHYLGSLDGKAVAASTLFLGAGVAGIYNVATLPEARGQGIGSAMTMAPLHAARDMGYRVGVLQSSDMGYRVYQRLGFRRVCQMEHFYWRGGGAQDGG